MAKKYVNLIIISITIITVYINCNKKPIIPTSTIHVDWLKEYIKEADFLSDEGKSLEDKSSFYYQRIVVDRIKNEKNFYAETDISRIVSFIKNTKKDLKFNRINDSLVLVKYLGFDSMGDITDCSQLWIKRNNSWSILDSDENLLTMPSQKVYLGPMVDKQGIKLIVNGGCCDTDSIVIFELLENGDIKSVYSNTLYGKSYSIEKDGDSYIIFEENVEGEKTKLDF